MKTTIEWYGQLPEGQREKAIHNHINCKNKSSSPDAHCSMRKALMYGFKWDDTPEGFRYWFDIWISYPSSKK